MAKNKYTKEGKGVSKNEPQKRAFFAFMDIYFSQFWDLIKVNMVLFASLIPLFMAFTFPATPGLLIMLLIFETLIIGPSLCGASYALRNLVARSHVWVWSDYKDIFIDNYKYGFIMGIIDVVFGWLLYVAYNYYAGLGGLPGQIMGAVIFVVAVIFVIMNMYIYPMIVTFDNKFFSHLKNALVFSVANLPRGVFALLIDGIVIGVLYYILFWWISNPMIAILLVIGVLAFFAFSLVGLINMFAIWPVLKPYVQAGKDETQQDSEETETLFSDEIIITEKDQEE